MFVLVVRCILTEFILGDVVSDYVNWVSDVVRLRFEKVCIDCSSWAVERFSRFGFGRNPGEGAVTSELKVEEIVIRSVKRRDDVYSSRLMSRIRRLSSAVGNVPPSGLCLSVLFMVLGCG